MRILSFLYIAILLSACKNNGSSNAIKTTDLRAKLEMKDVVIDKTRTAATVVDFSVLQWTIEGDVLEVVVRYSGGCKRHDFNAYFSGNWMKSRPAKAVIEIEHLNPKKDACRSLVKDTLKFNLRPIQYPSAYEVMVKWTGDPLLEASYWYGK